MSFWYGGKLVVEGEYSFLQFFKVLIAIVKIAEGVGQTASMAPDAAKAKRAASVIFSIVDRKSPIDSASNAGKTLEKIEGKNIFSLYFSLFFSYFSLFFSVFFLIFF